MWFQYTKTNWTKYPQQAQTTVSNTKSATIGAGTVYLSGAPEMCFGSLCSIFSIDVVFCWSLFVFWFIFFWSLCCLSFADERHLIHPLVHFLLAIVLSVLHWWKASDSRFGSFSFGHCVVCPLLMKGFWFSLWFIFFWPLCCLSFADERLLILPLVSSLFFYANICT